MGESIDRGGERSFAALQDLTVPRLGTAEQFVVGVSRCWDAFRADPDPTLPWRQLAPVFAYMNVMGALCAFDAAFRLLSRDRLCMLEFREVDSEPLGIAEARILCGLAALQRGKTRTAETALNGALSPGGVHALLPPLARIACILDGSEHRLPAWRDAPAPGAA